MEDIFKDKTIIVIDDSKFTLKVFADLLITAGCKVITCDDPLSAQDLVIEHNPDCIVSDYEMPNLTGLELCKIIKNEERLKEIPFIMLTSKDQDETIIDCINAGADDFLIKSANQKVIIAKVSAMLRIKAMRDEIIMLRQLSAVEGIIVTLKHEFNNVSTICIGQISRLNSILSKHGNLFSEDVEKFNNLKNNLFRLTDLIKKVNSIKTIKEVDYSEDIKMIDIHSENNT